MATCEIKNGIINSIVLKRKFIHHQFTIIKIQMAQHFSTLTEAITYVFQKESVKVLSLDRICQGLAQPNLFLQTSSGLASCDTISRRRVSSILSSSDLFVRAGPPRSCMWALKPSNPLCLSDGALLSCINTILTENGPLSAEGIIQHGDLTGATPEIIFDFLTEHSEYHHYENDTWWFTNQPIPERWEFDSVVAALTASFQVLQHEASIEELNWLLCQSTLPQGKKISRRKISRELSRRPDLFQHISRAKYAPTMNDKNLQSPPKPAMQYPKPLISSTVISPQISPPSSLSLSPQQLQQLTQLTPLPQLPQLQILPSQSIPQQDSPPNVHPNISSNIQQQNQSPSYSIPPVLPSCQQFQQSNDMMTDLQLFDTYDESQKMMELGADWMYHVPKCETPPVIHDYFDPDEFFAVGFAATFD
ncbi:hypothetical protein TRFO_06495 [Tritrichomonas foetus]|uniref:Uncharacterized protein n=1 Tax=Tritrichomonas foetus TaxID=1144522 RepID=A0A1J4JYW3_9EUKA|nr:hypothetical protein TRFO_06495 [Tritrichomonas foetus]|eukprot:OHT04163.1 hypothetical protein TRFO_06495 [Tritrichomonas foetus]